MSKKTADNAISVINQQIQSLSESVQQASSSHDFDAARERLRRWKERTCRLLSEKVHPNEGARLQIKQKGSFVRGQPLRNFIDEANMYRGFLQSLLEEVQQHPEDVLSVPIPAKVSRITEGIPESPRTNAVFIIHGRDELNRLRLGNVLRNKWQLEPIVLSEEPGKGRTLIEKFEQEAQRAAFAIALFTPDDFIKVPEGGSYAQARPNAVFELGWFYGRLGRDRVCIVFKKGTEIHSDLNGISRIEFSNSIEEKIGELEKELVSARILTS